jgi:hypothetical protein
MGLNASKVKGGNANKVEQPVMEAGTYPARLVQVIDFGLQPQRAFKGDPKPPAHEISTTYEFVDCFMVDEKGNDVEDKPRWVSESFPLRNIMAELATSTKRAKALDPEGIHNGDWPAMLGSPVNVTVVINESKGKVYTNIASTATMRAKDAQKCPELKNDTKFFDLSEPDLEVFNSLPEWIREKIKGNLNYAGSKLEALLNGGPQQPKKEEDKKQVDVEQHAAKDAGGDNQDEDAEQDAPW